jgi:FkbM family methyltransferase|tara:strand:- start:4744 stop:5436 length:693 start_codon:yes stop_codon:yes gene_type:complete
MIEFPIDRKTKRKLKAEYKKFLGAVERVDSDMIGESITNYLIQDVDYTDKVCLDLGANVGGFSKIAMDFGASKVISVECDPRNFNMLSDSFAESENVELIHGAITASLDETVKIYKNNSQKNHCSTSIIKKKNNQFKEYDEVRCINFNDLVEMHKPDIIKIDIEGAEYQIIEDVLAYYPDVLFIEMHAGTFDNIVRETIQLIVDKYPNNIVEPIIIFTDRLIGYDCFFKK